VLTLSLLSGEEVTVNAIRKDTGSQVRKRVAFELDLQPYRVTISTACGSALDHEKTLEECGILGDAKLFLGIGEADKWREMSMHAFIELVVARKLEGGESIARKLQQLRSQPAGFDEVKFRRRYIPRLEAMEEADERRRKREESRQNVQDSVASEASVMVSELGLEGAARAMQAKIVDVERSCGEKAARCLAIRDDAQHDLDVALPALHAAEQALSCITKQDICEVKALRTPPGIVALVGEAMCVLFEEKPSWENAKKLWQDCQLLQKMMEYDKDDIPPKVIAKLNHYVQLTDFTPAVVRRASLAAAGVCSWVHAMHTYDSIAEVVKPKKTMLLESEQSLHDTTWELENWRKQLADIVSPTDETEAA
jgi:hypothetical protein